MKKATEGKPVVVKQLAILDLAAVKGGMNKSQLIDTIASGGTTQGG